MNPYDVLGVSRQAGDKEIADAYRKLAMQYHPDRNPNNEEATKKFKECAAAFEVLSNPEKKSRYDQFGTTDEMPHKPFTSPFNDFVQGFFRQSRQPLRGADIVVEHSVSLQDVLEGAHHEVKYMRHMLCERCRGIGGNTAVCPTCKGTGSRVIYGPALTVKAPCQTCGGAGQVLGDVCKECQGGFKTPQEQTVNFEVPKGVEGGMRFCYRGSGEPIAGGMPGNLYIVINVVPHEFFERIEGGHIVCKVPVSYTQLVLGDEVMVPTLNGKVALVKIPSGTQSGSKFRLNGLGLPIFNRQGGVYSCGDEIVQVELEVPTSVEGRYKEVIARLAKLEKQHMTPKKKSFVEKAGA